MRACCAAIFARRDHDLDDYATRCHEIGHVIFDLLKGSPVTPDKNDEEFGEILDEITEGRQNMTPRQSMQLTGRATHTHKQPENNGYGTKVCIPTEAAENMTGESSF